MNTETKKIYRDSNVELLRVIAIMFVLVAHSICLKGGIGLPNTEDFVNSLVPSVSRVFYCSLSVICVDVFVIISGWYGIHASLKGLLKLMFICFFFGMIGYVLKISAGEVGFSLGDFVKSFVGAFFPGWFIAAYIVMYMLSPAVNLLIDKCSKNSVRCMLVTFFLLEFVYGWIFPEDGGGKNTFQQGYSADSLVLLYALAKYLRKYVFNDNMASKRRSPLNGGVGQWFAIWMLFVWFDVFVYVITCCWGAGQIYSRLFVYTSPIVIMQSVSMFMFFKQLRFQSRVVNWLATSSLGALFVHAYLGVKPFLNTCVSIYTAYDGVTCVLLLLAFMSLIFFVSVLLDQLRILIWRHLSCVVPNVGFSRV